MLLVSRIMVKRLQRNPRLYGHILGDSPPHPTPPPPPPRRKLQIRMKNIRAGDAERSPDLTGEFASATFLCRPAPLAFSGWCLGIKSEPYTSVRRFLLHHRIRARVEVDHLCTASRLVSAIPRLDGNFCLNHPTASSTRPASQRSSFCCATASP